MWKNHLQKQNGFSLAELLVAMLITAVLVAAVVSFYITTSNINTRINNETDATNQLKNAFNYINRDAEQAGLITITSPNNFPLTLSWFQNTANKTVIYTIVNGTLQRTQYLNNVLQSTMNVAVNVNPNNTYTYCIWDSTNHTLSINITISKGNVNEPRQFVITPRVVQISSQTADTISLNSSANPSTFGSMITLTATISPTAYSGTVTFLDNSSTIGIAPVVNGTATYSISTLAIGSHPLTAVYSGDAVYIASTSSVFSQLVNMGSATVLLTSPTNPSILNNPVTFTATVSPSDATGTIQFTIDGVNFGSPVPLTGGSAISGAIYTLSVGNHFITAVYSGDTNYHGTTSSILTQTVNKISTTVNLISSSPYAALGQSVTFTATVNPSAATGTVTFKDGSNTLGTGTVSSGVVTYSTSALTTGSHSITAAYSGDANYLSSTSSTLTQWITNVTATFSPSSGPVGTMMTVSGTGWAGSDTISSVTLGGISATKSLTVDSNGNLSGTITVPASAPTGLQTIIITGANTGVKTFTGVFKVTKTPALTNIGQANKTSASTSVNVSVPSGGVSAGYTIIVTFTMSSVTGTVSVSDTKGNTYTSDADVNYSTYERTLVFSAPVTNALISGNTITVTYPSATRSAVSVYYVNDSILPKDQSSTTTGNNSSPSSGNTANTTQDYELLIGAVGYNNNSTFTAGSGFAALTKSSSSSSLTIQPEYQIVTLHGAYAASGSISTSGRWATAIVTYKIQ